MLASIDTGEFKRVIKALKPFTRQGNDMYNGKMPYIYLEFDSANQEVRAEAIDGHRVAVEYLKCKIDESFIAYIKPFTFLKTDSTNIEIELINDIVTVDFGDYFLRFKQPEGEWYPTKKLIADSEEEKAVLRVGVNADLLIDALKEVQKGNSGRNAVIIECRNKRAPIFIRSEKDRRNVRLVLPMRYPGDEVEE